MDNNTSSKAPQEVDPSVINHILKYFFNPGTFGKHLTDVGFDVTHLTKTKKETMQKAEDTLLKLAEKFNKMEVTEDVKQHQDTYENMKALSDEFYRTIPHLPTVQQIPIEREEHINSKFSLIQNVNYALDSFATINSTKPSGDFLQSLYKNLQFDIKPLSKDSPSYSTIKEYGDINSQAANSTISVEVTDIFECSLKEGKDSKQEAPETTNKILLWYGDRPSSYAGILAQGFQHKSRSLNRGQPFFSLSDSVIKSLSYCYLERGDPQGFLLLCEADLGELKEVQNYQDLQNIGDVKSAKVTGKLSPKPETEKTLDGNVKVPIGKVEMSNEDAKILYNDYLVYNADQIRLRYVVRFSLKPATA